jgi:hypothetical protein
MSCIFDERREQLNLILDRVLSDEEWTKLVEFFEGSEEQKQKEYDKAWNDGYDVGFSEGDYCPNCDY